MAMKLGQSGIVGIKLVGIYLKVGKQGCNFFTSSKKLYIINLFPNWLITSVSWDIVSCKLLKLFNILLSISNGKNKL